MKSIGTLVLALLFFIGGAAAQEVFEKSELVIVTSAGPKTFQIEIATTSSQQAQGLMYRRTMAADAGMLFPYTSPRRLSFWMKNTFIPLDLLFIAADGRIASIQQRTVPQSLEPIRSRGKVLAVLELNGGTVSRLNIKPGDRVEHAVFEK
jgi:uncharacterized membrane protein (UPF0127 family)